MRAVIGLGANLGDRLGAMRSALAEVGKIARVEKVSRVYATAPVGGPPQPDYLNAAACVVFESTAEDLLDALLAIEARLGRVRAERNGPRTIDLDLLWIEGVVVQTDRLEVPHPRLKDRAFALAPMQDVAPFATDPRTGEPYIIPPGGFVVVSDSLGGRSSFPVGGSGEARPPLPPVPRSPSGA
jgi:2-amino-4-hydroxy-6-hydroxymethyldihydropteridine diphosphokinase